jgi:hypothetical protein
MTTAPVINSAIPFAPEASGGVSPPLTIVTSSCHATQAGRIRRFARQFHILDSNLPKIPRESPKVPEKAPKIPRGFSKIPKISQLPGRPRVSLTTRQECRRIAQRTAYRIVVAAKLRFDRKIQDRNITQEKTTGKRQMCDFPVEDPRRNPNDSRCPAELAFMSAWRIRRFLRHFSILKSNLPKIPRESPKVPEKAPKIPRRSSKIPKISQLREHAHSGRPSVSLTARQECRRIAQLTENGTVLTVAREQSLISQPRSDRKIQARNITQNKTTGKRQMCDFPVRNFHVEDPRRNPNCSCCPAIPARAESKKVFQIQELEKGIGEQITGPGGPSATFRLNSQHQDRSHRRRSSGSS